MKYQRSLNKNEISEITGLEQNINDHIKSISEITELE